MKTFVKFIKAHVKIFLWNICNSLESPYSDRCIVERVGLDYFSFRRKISERDHWIDIARGYKRKTKEQLYAERWISQEDAYKRLKQMGVINEFPHEKMFTSEGGV